MHKDTTRPKVSVILVHNPATRWFYVYAVNMLTDVSKVITFSYYDNLMSLQWRHNEHDDVSNH